MYQSFFGGWIDEGCEIDTEMAAPKKLQVKFLLLCFFFLCGPMVCEVEVILVDSNGEL